MQPPARTKGGGDKIRFVLSKENGKFFAFRSIQHHIVF